MKTTNAIHNTSLGSLPKFSRIDELEIWLGLEGGEEPNFSDHVAAMLETIELMNEYSNQGREK